MVIDTNGQKVYQTDNKAIASAREDVQKANYFDYFKRNLRELFSGKIIK